MRKGGNPKIGRVGSGVFGVGRRRVGSWIAERRTGQFWKEWAAVIAGVGIGDRGGNVVDVWLKGSLMGVGIDVGGMIRGFGKMGRGSRGGRS